MVGKGKREKGKYQGIKRGNGENLGLPKSIVLTNSEMVIVHLGLSAKT